MWKKHTFTTTGMNMIPKRGSVEEQRFEYKIFTQGFPVYIIKMKEMVEKRKSKRYVQNQNNTRGGKVRKCLSVVTKQ